MKFNLASLALALGSFVATSTTNAYTPNPPNSKPTNKNLDYADLNISPSSLENFDINALTKMMYQKIDEVQIEKGQEPLTEEAKDEIVATALAGSVVGTAVGSPLLVGAALGYAGSQFLQGEQAENARHAIGKASKDLLAQANAAATFTAKQLEEEKDLSAASKKILLAIQDRANEVQQEFSSEKLMDELQTQVKKTVESEEFKQLPKNAFDAVKNFMSSDEVKQASNSALQAIKHGLESDEMKALQSRASQTLADTINKSSNNNKNKKLLK
eukprot:CAMPEP_0113453868 /NCGR_PEP_ID=MMETSP0014_2-20120614/7574_1 /TAXON_ID=2857 /ORGANISM="Nitzschia sp." /LENGTH=271 /DNA_ID=CAMNT_0000345265 /DNA_START=138 /DNA_END=953 /DNA_ORIENTATION=+ /assembly_acc=CAM_ASM_000159